MDLFLRKIDNPHAWDQPENSDKWKWLPSEDFVPDLLSDLPTKDGKLSVFSILNDETNLREVAVALSAQRGKFDRFVFVLFPETLPAGLGIAVKVVAGNTPDQIVNAAHRDLAEISATRLLNAARNILKDKTRIGFVGERELLSGIVEALKAGRFAKKAVKDWERFYERAKKLGIEIPPEITQS